jgi:hypothetical protein
MAAVGLAGTGRAAGSRDELALGLCVPEAILAVQVGEGALQRRVLGRCPRSVLR